MKSKISKLLIVAAITMASVGWGALKVGATTTGEPLRNGAWLGQWPTTEAINKLQEAQDKKMDYVNMFINFSTSFNAFKANVDSVYEDGAQLILTWEPQGITDDQISNGSKDDYIRQMASDLKNYNKPMVIRLMHEVNGNWYSWATGYNNGTVNSYDQYKRAYQHVVEIFRNEGATNIKFMYNVNSNSVGNNTDYMAAYPGNDYVDILSIDGYNWGTTQSWGSSWQSFDQIFGQAYNVLKAYNKPIFIPEIGSANKGGDKAAWITDAYNRIRSSYPLIDAVIWFNENKETDWTVNSNSDVLSAYKSAIMGPVPTSFNWAYEDANNDGSWNYSSVWGGSGSSIEASSQWNNVPMSTQVKYEGNSSLKFHFKHTSYNGYAGASIPTSEFSTGLEPYSDVGCNAGKNLTRTTYLKFYILGDSNSKARIKLRDVWGNETNPVELTDYVTASNSGWQQVTIPISNLTSAAIDKNNISAVKFLIDGNTYQPGEWTFYVDNMNFSN
ncbi:beta-mannanase [Clostridium acetobutylicum]|uniref:Endoglucanase, family 26 S-layer homology domain n=1 Tax=Clostridium acetobutylicum (strain ATCC 824 / DSM 792 / JCM 1419 / IAM 19013 / LMG 5710 / NBRC 13948 / NRRL B-527 / VKM B-1787 / 2291 / W) TaxID=272562 RepID=Q97G16_CLOAB|nr:MULTISPECIES: glycoside hydrolase family 26 protein [Clostridium]AAK80507.1 Endoglucanase, family 26; S-layer homology domain [Clostridium acetobutylicum ATCC 824]ADZ21606.1 Endoglucanase [Clostridium acetobutylicum EA 2018]AEI34297.1 endoglucanase family protein [Clostridium acetobutylicum DSM 1731]AWV79075.1 endoglucanase [Clostridium acetobutylicum]MBC2394963.1 endoglucanase [Clostridium acetobutylicum]